jgi:hypothetical protein
MSKKIDINKTAEVIKRHEIEPDTLRAIIEELNLLANPESDEEKPPAIKKQWAILISDPERRIPTDFDFAGWVLQIPENESVMTTQERIHKAAYLFNTSKKGRLMPAKTIGETLEHVPAFFFKENDLFVKTKTPVLVLTTDNEIPTEKTERSVA